jgi:GNAT superfamily N-acetyltransferase
MDPVELLKRLDEERRNVARGQEVLDLLPAVTRVRSPYHAISFSALTADNADAAIVEQVEHHRKLGVEFEWKLYAHDTPADLRLRLERHEFRIGPLEAVLVFELSEACEWIERVDSSAVLRVELPEHVEIYRKVAEAVFEKKYDLTARELTGALSTGSTHVRGYIAYAADQPVSIGRLYTHPHSLFGGLYGGGTLPAFRGRGFYRALVATRARDAIAAGASYLIVDALPTSRPILERLGFQWLTDTWACEWHPPAKKFTAKARSREEDRKKQKDG